MRFAEFEDKLKQQKFSSCYFLCCGDAYLIDLARDTFIRALEVEWGGQVSVASVDLDETSVDELVNSAQSLSMFAPRQLIVIKSVMKLRESQGRRLADYLSDPNPESILLFLGGAIEKDQRKKKIFEILAKRTSFIEFDPMGIAEISERLLRIGRDRGFEIDHEALEFLIELQGTDLGRLQQELEKAMLYSSGEKRLTLGAVQAVSGFGTPHTLFEFISAVAKKDRIRCLTLAEEVFFTSKESGLAFWWFGQQLRQWLQFKELSGRLPASLIGRQVGVYSSNVAALMERQARSFSRGSLIQALRSLGCVDDKMKSSQIDSRFALEELIWRLTD